MENKDFEGSIVFLQSGVIEEQGENKLEWADQKDIDKLLKEGKMKKVSLIKLRNKDNEVESFRVDPNLTLEQLNISYNYSHLQSHMISGNKIKINYITSKSTNRARNRETIKLIIGLKFIDHEH
ncbi:MAG: hypothetical protein GWO78_07180 [Dehalococcoidales bacterium]|jgi:hypothetical protein|nr:hypothetical protein [Dehalococcoidia bacterium]NCG35750.1 hypothetical protein [Dehalococcoidales bacterium]